MTGVLKKGSKKTFALTPRKNIDSLTKECSYQEQKPYVINMNDEMPKKYKEWNLETPVHRFIQLLQEVLEKIHKLSSIRQDSDLMDIEKQLADILLEMSAISNESADELGFQSSVDGDPNFLDFQVKEEQKSADWASTSNTEFVVVDQSSIGDEIVNAPIEKDAQTPVSLIDGLVPPLEADTSKGQTPTATSSSYSCDKCDRTFSKPQYLSTHSRKIHGSVVKLACETCGNSFARVKDLKKHKSTAKCQPRPIFSCRQCGEAFAIEKSLEAHRKLCKEEFEEESESITDSTPHCEASFGDMQCNDALSLALQQANVMPGPSTAPSVDSPITDVMALSAISSGEIWPLAVGQRRPSCSECGKKFKDESSLNKHKAYVHSEKTHLCPECGKLFNLESKMQQHRKACHENQKFACEICEKEFSTKVYLMKHTKEVHDGKRPRHLCTICGKEVIILKSHMESVHLGVKYPCDKCGKEFATPPGLKVHILTFHEGNKYPCTLCGKVFGHKGYLKNHVDMVHKGKKYPCKVCGKEFNDSRSRRQHTELTHQGKKHTCKLCNKDFTRHDHLMRHKQSVHEGKRFPCSICGKEFSQSGDLKRHVDTVHQGNSRSSHSAAQTSALKITEPSEQEPLNNSTLPSLQPMQLILTQPEPQHPPKDLLASAAAVAAVGMPEDFMMSSLNSFLLQQNSFLQQKTILEQNQDNELLMQPKIEVTSAVTIDHSTSLQTISMTQV